MNVFSHWRWKTSRSFHWCNGRSFDMEKPIDVVRFNFWGAVYWCKEWPRNARFTLADWLARWAAWCRGERWYVADAWHGVPGNRAAELRQQIRDELIGRLRFSDDEGRETIERVERLSAELAQLAGEKWGHVWPKEGGCQ